MTREKEIEQASVDYQMSKNPMAIGGDAFADMIYKMNINPSFIAGAEWADEHPILEMKEVDFEKELDKEWDKCEPTDEGMGLEIASIEHEQFDNIAKHFFELGLKVQKDE